MAQAKCKRKETGERPPCACGCGKPVGKKPGSVFAPPGHDGKLRGYIKRGDADRLAEVNWWGLPLCFHGGDYTALIERRRAASRRAEPAEFVLVDRSDPCLLDS